MNLADELDESVVLDLRFTSEGVVDVVMLLRARA